MRGVRVAMPARKAEFCAKALAVPILLHGLYDWPLMLMDPDQMSIRGADWVLAYPWPLIALAVLGVEAWISVRLYRRLRRAQGRAIARAEAAPG